MEWWIWTIVGFGCMLAELVVPAFVLVWFGLAGLLVGGIVYLAPELEMVTQLSLWVVLSLVLVVAWFKVFKQSYHKSLIGRSSANIVGEIGLLTENVAPFQNGKVRFQRPIVGSDIWECVADKEIKVGTRVKVVSVDGSLLTVTSLEQTER